MSLVGFDSFSLFFFVIGLALSSFVSLGCSSVERSSVNQVNEVNPPFKLVPDLEVWTGRLLAVDIPESFEDHTE